MEEYTRFTLVNIVVPQIFPETLVTNRLPQGKLERLEILENINKTLTNDERNLLFYVHCQLGLTPLDPTTKNLPSFQESEREFREFAFGDPTGQERIDVLKNVSVSLSREGHKFQPLDVSTAWEALFNRISQLVEADYDLKIFRSFMNLKNTPLQSEYEDAITQRRGNAYSFCLACHQNSGVSEPGPLVKSCLQEMGGNRE